VSYAASGAALRMGCGGPPSGSGIVASTRSASADGVESIGALLGTGWRLGGVAGAPVAGAGGVLALGGVPDVPAMGGAGAQPASASTSTALAHHSPRLIRAPRTIMLDSRARAPPP
jgi:hypothetical protein